MTVKHQEKEIREQKPKKGKRQYYQGKYDPINKEKYLGNIHDIIFRSRWELLFFKFCDLDKNVLKWNSEGVIVPYVCRTDNRTHRYFVDVYVEFRNGAKVLIEIKPEKDTKPAKTGGNRKESTVIMETVTYAKNISKWDAASKFAKDRGMEFWVLTETALRNMGIKI